MTPEDRERLADVLRRGGLNGEAKVDDFRMYGSARRLYLSISIISRPIEGRIHGSPSVRTERDLVDVRSHTISEIQRAAATGIYDIRGGGAKRKLPHFDDLLFWARRSRAIRSKAIARSAGPMSCWARASPKSPFISRRR